MLYSKIGKRFLPKWYIYVFDIIIVFLLTFLSFFVRINFTLSGFPMGSVLIMGGFCSFIYGFFFLQFRTHSGIIRHTGFQDIFKVVVASVIAFFTALVIVAVLSILGERPQFLPPISVLMIHFLFVSTLLSASRLFVKWAHSVIKKSDIKKHQRVVIFGAGVSGRITLSTLQADQQVNYHILAFLDDDSSLKGKFIDGVPVYSPEEFLQNGKMPISTNNNGQLADLLVISAQQLRQDRRKEIMEMSLAKNMTVKVVPPVIKWINGSLSTAQLRKVRIEELLERPKIELYSQALSQSLQGKVVMVTGAAGSIGSELVRQVLQHNPEKLILFDHAESGLFDLHFAIKHDAVLGSYAHLLHPVVGSVTDTLFLKATFETFRPEIIYHAAAYKHVPLMEENPYMAISVNVFGTKNLVDVAIKYSCKKFVYVSTDKAVNPSSVMGATKRIAEMYVQCQKNQTTQFITTRFGNVLDSNGSVTQIFQKQLELGGPLTITHKEIYRYFMLISEACSLVLEAGVMGKGGEIFIFDMGKMVKIYDLARNMIQLNGLVPNKDIEIKVTGLRPGEKLYEELLNDKEATLPTHHPKIMRARADDICCDKIEQHLNELFQESRVGHNNSIVAKMMEIVAEYDPLNTVYVSNKANGGNIVLQNNDVL